jgi:HK97 family phage portal protein
MENKEITVSLRNNGKWEKSVVKVAGEQPLDTGDSRIWHPLDPSVFLMNPASMGASLRDAWQYPYPTLISFCKGVAYTCVNLRASTVSKSQLIVKKLIKQDKYITIDDLNDDVYKLFDRPQQDSDITWYDLLYDHMLNLLVFGNSWFKYIRSKRFFNPQTGLGLPIEIHALPIYSESSMTPIFKNKMLVAYEYRPYGTGSAEKYIYDKDDIVHLSIPSLMQRIFGSGVMNAGADVLIQNKMISRFQTAYFASGLQQNMVMTNKQQIDQDELDRYKAKWRELYGRLNPGDAIFMQDGWEANPSSWSPRQSELLATQKYIHTQIMSLFQIPAGMLALNQESVNKASSSNNLKQIKFLCLDNDLLKLDTKWTRSIQRNFGKPDYFIEHRLSVPTEDMAEADKGKILLAAGAGTRNELRKIAGLSDLTDPKTGEPDPRGFELVEPTNVNFNSNPDTAQN